MIFTSTFSRKRLTWASWQPSIKSLTSCPTKTLVRYCCFLHREESWRIPAYLSMKRVFFEALVRRSRVLRRHVTWIQRRSDGLPKKERERKRVGWLGPTCYFLVSNSQRDAIRRLANRCIDPSSISEDIEVFFSTDNLAPKGNAHQLIPGGTSLCRASIKFGFFKNLFARDTGCGQKVQFFVSTINSIMN